jgi:MFS family permease
MHHLLTALPQSLLAFIRSDFGLTPTEIGFVMMAFTLANAFSQLPGGWLADRIGTRILITFGILGVAVFGVFVGLSHTYIMMIVALMLMGLVAGGYHPAATPMISASVEPSQRGRALGFHLIGGNASFFLTPLIGGAIAAAWGWRASFLSLAIPSAIFGAFFYFYMSRRPGMSLSGGRKQVAAAEVTPAAPGHVRRLVAFLVLTVLAGGVGMSIMPFIPIYAVDSLGISEQGAASLLSISWSAGLWAGPLGGYISDRIGRLPVIVAAGVLGGVLIYGLNVAPWGIWFWGLLLFMGLSHTMRMPVSEAYLLEQTNERNRSTIYGIYYFTMGGTGAVFSPIVGYVIENWGYEFCFNIAAAAAVAVTLLCWPFLRGGESRR